MTRSEKVSEFGPPVKAFLRCFGMRPLLVTKKYAKKHCVVNAGRILHAYMHKHAGHARSSTTLDLGLDGNCGNSFLLGKPQMHKHARQTLANMQGPRMNRYCAHGFQTYTRTYARERTQKFHAGVDGDCGHACRYCTNPVHANMLGHARKSTT